MTAGKPATHDLVAAVHAPALALSAPDGQLQPGGAQGYYVGDRRVLSALVLTVDGAEPRLVAAGASGDRAAFAGGSIRRDRVITAAGGTETITIMGGEPGTVTVSLALAADLAAMPTVRGGLPTTPIPPTLATGQPGTDTASHALAADLAAMPTERAGQPTPTTAEPSTGTASPTPAADLAAMPTERAGQPTPTTAEPSTGTASPTPAADLAATPIPPTPTAAGLRWTAPDGLVVEAHGSPAPDAVDPAAGRLDWTIAVAPGRPATVALTIAVRADPVPVAVLPAADRPALTAPEISAEDPALPALVARGVADLTALQLADPLDPADVTLAAGAPWYLTLFGRDSLWAAGMLLPLGTRLAGGTLRALARRQATRTDPATAAAPGKIPHLLRRTTTEYRAEPGTGRPLRLPALYYGTVDATPLWITLLHDAWRWGLPATEVEPLLDPMLAALAWLRTDGVDDSGFVRYVDASGHGLVNQGWKDSPDAVRFASGARARGPVALAEVQAYAHAAARHGADLLDTFGRPGGARWRDFAEGLRARFRARFWVEDAEGPHPAIALDGRGRSVDSLTSNIGHLLGTGLLDAAEAELVVRRLAGPDLDGGLGLRTLSLRAKGFNPLSYHCGSVWPHDTAIAVAGLRATGTPAADAAAAGLVRGLLAAAPAFDHRLPELFGGLAEGGRPVPYPTACRPQAWSAATGVALLRAILGLSADVPAGTLRLAPLRPSPVGALTVRGLDVGGRLDVRLAADGTPTVLRAPPGLTVLPA